MLGKFHGQSSLVGYSPWGHERVGHDLVIKQQQSMLAMEPEFQGPAETYKRKTSNERLDKNLEKEC